MSVAARFTTNDGFEPAINEFILRSLQSRRLEGWPSRRRPHVGASFETPAAAGPQDGVAASFPRFSSACARMADKVVVGAIASGSTLTCRIEGRPDAKARS